MVLLLFRMKQQQKLLATQLDQQEAHQRPHTHAELSLLLGQTVVINRLSMHASGSVTAADHAQPHNHNNHNINITSTALTASVATSSCTLKPPPDLVVSEAYAATLSPAAALTALIPLLALAEFPPTLGFFSNITILACGSSAWSAFESS